MFVILRLQRAIELIRDDVFSLAEIAPARLRRPESPVALGRGAFTVYPSPSWPFRNGTGLAAIDAMSALANRREKMNNISFG